VIESVGRSVGEEKPDRAGDPRVDEKGEMRAGRVEVERTLSNSRRIDSFPSHRCKVGL